MKNVIVIAVLFLLAACCKNAEAAGVPKLPLGTQCAQKATMAIRLVQENGVNMDLTSYKEAMQTGRMKPAVYYTLFDINVLLNRNMVMSEDEAADVVMAACKRGKL